VEPITVNNRLRGALRGREMATLCLGGGRGFALALEAV
jgi:hypothetical protein